jgi:hypothetical protein
VANGRERAKESDPAVITARWREFFEKTVGPAFEHRRAASGRWHRWNGTLKTKVQDLQERFWH